MLLSFGILYPIIYFNYYSPQAFNPMSHLHPSFTQLFRLLCPRARPTLLSPSSATRRRFLSSLDATLTKAPVSTKTSADLTDISEKDFKPRKALLVRKVTRYEYEKIYLKPDLSEQQLKEHVRICLIAIK